MDSVKTGVAQVDPPVSRAVNCGSQLLRHRGSSQGAQSDSIAALWLVLGNTARGREGRQLLDGMNQTGH